MSDTRPWTEAEYAAAWQAAVERGTNSPGPLSRGPVPVWKAARRDGTIVEVDDRTFDPSSMERL